MRLSALFLVSFAGLQASSPLLVSPAEPFRFTVTEDKLLHASLIRGYGDLPGNLDIVELQADGSAEAWSDEVRSYSPENTQTHPRVWAFRSGMVRKGRRYEARVTAPGSLDLRYLNAPAEQPQPERSVNAGMSWLIRSADAWLSNQPRHGAVAKDGQQQHPEARACIACHITQFSTRAYLTASLNGYPSGNGSAGDGPALNRVVGRLRDNPRPLYGHPGVNWTRVIYSARTVSSRVPVLLSMHSQLTGSPAAQDRELILGAARFLLLSDECGSGSLRAEADGSRPDVSGFEIGFQTHQTFRLAASLEPANVIWTQNADCVERLLVNAKPANVIDAAWRIVALKKLGRPTNSAVADLLTWQQNDGRFSMEFSKSATPSDFISYHVLYALAVAQYRGPEVDKLVRYALLAQRPDGSWKGDPEYKGFDTPFRDTQFAVMALSELYPQTREEISVDPEIISSSTDAWRSGNREALQVELLARMTREEEPERPLIEAFAATLDENLSQLREWQRAMRMPADQVRVEQALRADSQRQASLLAKALAEGNRAQRLRVLTAITTVVGVDGFVARPRVGNDMEPPQFLSDDGAALEQAILACFNPNDPEMTRAAIRAGTALSDVLTPAFTLGVLRLGSDFAPTVTEAFGEGKRGRLTLARNIPVDPELQATVRRILQNREPQSLAVALHLLAALEPGHAFTREPYLAGAMESLLNDRLEENVLKAAAVFFHIANGPLMRYQVLDALKSNDSGLVRAAVDVVVDRYIVNPNVVELALQFLSHSRGLSRRMLLDSLDPSRVSFRLDQINAYSPPRVPMPLDSNVFSVPFVQDFVVSSLRDQDPQVQAAALDLTRKQDRLRSLAAVQTALAELSTSTVSRTQMVTRAIVQKQELNVAAEQMLDFGFFRERVLPILQKAGPDGRSCAMCHASNARFPIRSDAKDNFHAVARKVNVLSPADSLILVKPLLPGVTSDGDVFRTSHNGGERWAARLGSSEYQTILEWIRGGKLPSDTN
ncbi:MAG: terpene cyclase/mutase family protein [Bryobacteraceae bacterium]|nr:terpene cyclase/mutase family protein [Bryobacteraceae bacterium]